MVGRILADDPLADEVEAVSVGPSKHVMGLNGEVEKGSVAQPNESFDRGAGDDRGGSPSVLERRLDASDPINGFGTRQREGGQIPNRLPGSGMIFDSDQNG